MRTTCVYLCLLATYLLSPHPARGQGKAEASEPHYSVLEKLARDTLRNDDWKNAKWTDPGIEKEFARVIQDIARLTKNEPPKLKLPVSVSNVKFIPEKEKPIAGGRRVSLEDELIVGENLRFNRARNSIIIADGNVRIGSAQRCIIFSRGATVLGGGYGNVVISGHFIYCAHEGAAPDHPLAGRYPPSIMLSGGYLHISHSHGTICHAPQFMEAAHARGTVFWNSPNVRTSHEKNCTRLTSDKVRIFPPLANPLAEKEIVVLKGVPGNDAGKPGQATLNVGKRQYVVTEGEEVGQAVGAPVAALAGWKLSYVCVEYALFTKGKADAGFWIGNR